MELAVEKGRSEIVYFFFKETDIDTSQFNEVINSWSVFCAMHHSVMLVVNCITYNSYTSCLLMYTYTIQGI